MTDTSIYTNATSAEQVLNSLQIIANNLSNLNTTAFRADYENLVQQSFVDPVHQTRMIAISKGTYTDQRPGPINNTGRELDIALQGPGYIAVQTPQGEKGFTRAGSFDITPDGILITNKGDMVLGNGGIITVPPQSRVSIDNHGIVSALIAGQANSTLERVDTISVVEAPQEQMVKGLDGLFHPTGGILPAPAKNTNIIPRALEGSNVDPISELVSLVDCSRQFDFQTKQMQTVSENATKANQLLNVQI